MTHLSFELNNLFMLHVPFLIIFVCGSQKALFEQKRKVSGHVGSKKAKRAVCWQRGPNSRFRWQQTTKETLNLHMRVFECFISNLQKQ
jgi:hypothetical protein